MTITMGLAIAQALTVSPLIIKGTAKGMKTTMPTAASIINAAVDPASPLALLTIAGRNGAQGAIPIKTSPVA